MPGTAHNAGEDGARRIIAGESGFDHSRSIVAHKRRNLSIVSHVYKHKRH
jgi:hypothetical protein